MNADDLIALNEQIAAMARAGLPLDRGLASLAREMGRGQLRNVTEALARDLQAGHPLPEALARQEGRIPPYYANLVTAGVQTGRLPQVLTTLTTYAKSVAITRTTVVEALIYPTVVLLVGFALFTAVAFYIVPQYEQTFKEFGLRLPFATELVLTIGRNPVEIIVIPTAILVGGLALAWMWSRTSPRGRRIWVRAVYLVPLVGSIIRAARLAAFIELLGMLVEYGVPLPTAFGLAGAASSDPLLADQAGDVERRLREGMSLAEAFRGRALAPDWVVWLAAAGEQRNALAPALREIAAVYRRQVDNRSAVLRSVLPPLVVIVTAGVLTALFSVAMISPMVKLLEGLSKG